MKNSKALFIVPRFSPDIAGGAEALVAQYAFESVKIFKEVQIWTTCAKDHRTWDNFFQEGQEQINGLTVCKFPVSDRNVDTFLKAEIEMAQGYGIEIQNQIDWLKNGVNSNKLYHKLQEEGDSFDYIICAPYLFPVNFWSMMIAKQFLPNTRTILVPCLHDEHYAYQEVIYYLFKSVDGLMFNADAEKRLAEKIYGEKCISHKSTIVGMGFDFEVDKKLTSENTLGDYIVYCGRKEEGKNVGLLIEYFCEAFNREEELKDLKLVFLGSGDLDFAKKWTENNDNIVELGFVSEEEKSEIISGALALCQPSVNESFSIVLFEAWRYNTPVIVHSECDVTKEHVDKSGGGWSFKTKEEFLKICKNLVSSESIDLQRVGEKGRLYSVQNYSIETITEKLTRAFKKFA